MSASTQREATDAAPGSMLGAVTDAVAGRSRSEVGADAPADVDGVLVLEDLLVEDVSIDGMCGVY
jgi:mycofactocin precursor